MDHYDTGVRFSSPRFRSRSLCCAHRSALAPNGGSIPSTGWPLRSVAPYTPGAWLRTPGRGSAWQETTFRVLGVRASGMPLLRGAEGPQKAGNRGTRPSMQARALWILPPTGGDVSRGTVTRWRAKMRPGSAAGSAPAVAWSISFHVKHPVEQGTPRRRSRCRSSGHSVAVCPRWMPGAHVTLGTNPQKFTAGQPRYPRSIHRMVGVCDGEHRAFFYSLLTHR